MRLKKKKQYKTEKVSFRLTKEEFNKLKGKALLLCDGNISEFVLYAALHFKPEAEDIERESEDSPKY